MFHLIYPFPDCLFIENFKAIGSIQRVPIRPLTLLFGQNSAGKSSVLHAIALMAHLSEHGLKRDVEKVDLNGTEIRLGGLATFRHRGTKSGHTVLGWRCGGGDLSEGPEVIQKVTLSLLGGDRLIVSKYSLVENGVELLTACWSDKHIKPKRGQKIRPHYFAIDSIDRPFVDSLRAKAVSQLLKSVAMRGESRRLRDAVARVVETVSLSDEIYNSVVGYLARIPLDECKFDPEQMVPPRTWHDSGNDAPFIEELRLAAEQKQPAKRIHDVLCRKITEKVVLSVDQHIRDLPYADLRKVAYFGKHRPEVALDDIFTKEDRRRKTNLTTAEYSRGWAFDDTSVANLNDWLQGTGRSDLDYELKLVELCDFEEAIEPESKYMLRLYDKRQKKYVSFDEIGSGIGQLLPVLLAAGGEAGTAILVEQPELHLHPALQAEIADAFIHSALGETEDGEPFGNRLVLETHSEHILLRVMRRIRQTTLGQLPKGLPSIKPEDVAVLYVEKSLSGPGSIVRELRLNELGQLIDDWPGGFFEEGIREVLM
jgi:hypothetical protein